MTPSQTKLRIAPRKAPRQARSTFTVQAILDAAARVLQEGSLAGFNTNKVAEMAGVSVGSVYQYFPSKDALMARLIAQEQERLALAVEACTSGGRKCSLKQELARLVKVAAVHQWGSPVFAAALDHEEQRLPLREQLHAFQGRVIAAVSNLLERHYPGHRPTVYWQAAKDCVLICKALVEAQEPEPGGPSKAFEARLVNTLGAVLATQLRPLAG